MMVWLTGVGENAWRQDNSGRNDHPPLGRVIISSPAPTYLGRQTNRYRQGRPDAPRRGNELVGDLVDSNAHGDHGHEVSAIRGAGKEAQAAAVRTCTRMSRPVLQSGHRRSRSSAAESRLPGESALASLTACGAASKDRHSASFSFRLRLAKNPK